MTGENATLYSKRFDMFPLLKSAAASGREYALFSTDETIDLWQDFATTPNGVKNQTPPHVLALITQNRKLSVYSNWTPGTVDIANDGRQDGELYNISTPTGRYKLDNLYRSSANASEVAAMKNLLLNDLVPNEMRAPLPESLRTAQNAAKQQIIDYYLSQQS
uniref:Putative arylsulfatase n=1 Tax=Polynucleobacter necessarius subsp. necessarius (strain STIR1) TaxID=452638 RepID=B1XUF3_POLNS